MGVVKILEPMSPMFNYFEYEIVDKGRRTAIGIGLGEQKYPLDRMPGWNRNGIGYHADDGRLFHQDGMGRAYGPLCTTGDRMGCGVDFSPEAGANQVSVFFTKNGEQAGEPVRMKRPVFGLYPLIGLHSDGETVRYLGHWRRTPHTITEPMETQCFPSAHWLRSNAVRFTDGLTLEYDGDGLNKQDVGIAQANFRLTPTNHYFEMEILDSGQEGWVALGLAKTTYPLTKHPGWAEGSVGYHADNGHLYKETGQGDPFGPTCTAGDIMGCGIKFPAPSPPTARGKLSRKISTLIDLNYHDPESSDSEIDDIDPSFAYEEGDDYSDYSDYYEDEDYRDYQEHFRIEQERRAVKKGKRPSEQATSCTVYFTKNGEVVGETECVIPKGGFYPVVAMLSKGEKVTVDFSPLSG